MWLRGRRTERGSLTCTVKHPNIHESKLERGHDANSMWDAVGWQADCSVSGNCVSIHRRTKGALERTSARRFGLIPLQVSPCHSHLLFLHEKHGSLCCVSVRWATYSLTEALEEPRALFCFLTRTPLDVRSAFELTASLGLEGRKETLDSSGEVIREVIRPTSG